MTFIYCSAQLSYLKLNKLLFHTFTDYPQLKSQYYHKSSKGILDCLAAGFSMPAKRRNPQTGRGTSVSYLYNNFDL